MLVLGPTAVGKTDVAMALQDQLGGPECARLISADSAMVYRGLDIGTAKPDAGVLEQYPHDLIDIRDPAQTYTAADFVADADRCVGEAFARQQVPVMVGGTMLYAKRFLEGMAELPHADLELRAELQQALADGQGARLHAELTELDPAAAQNIHPNNAQRLVRALEVIRLTGRPLSAQWREAARPSAVERLAARVTTFAIIPADRRVLHERITRRFDAMLAAGFEQELQSLSARQDLHAGLPSMRAVGYRQGLQFLTGELTGDEFRDQAIAATRRLAKRQLTWLRHWPDLRTLTCTEAPDLATVIRQHTSTG